MGATVHALDATTIDLCLGLFSWAPIRTTKAAIKLHTLIDLRGSIPSFIHISDGKMYDAKVLDILVSQYSGTSCKASFMAGSDKPLLHEANTQQGEHRKRRPTGLARRRIRLNQRDQRGPMHYQVHAQACVSR